VEFVDDMLSTEKESIWMGLRVIADRVIRRGYFGGKTGIFIDVLPEKEKCRTDFMSF
jgi:hypothetical protein